MLLELQNSGVTIVGPATTSATALNNRGNTNPEQYDFDINGASNVTIENVSVTGGLYGMFGESSTGAPGLTVINSTFYGNPQGGIYLAGSSPNSTFTGNNFDNVSEGGQMVGLFANADLALVNNNTATGGNEGLWINGNSANINNNTVDQSSTGIGLDGNQGVVSSNLVSNGGTGINLGGNSDQVINNVLADNGTGISVTGSNMQVDGNSAFGGSTGISLSGSGEASNNVVNDDAGVGLDAIGSPLLISSNLAYRDGTGIIVGGGAVASQNLAHHNNIGIATDYSSYSATITDNRAYANIVAGINAFGTTAVTGNDVYGNSVGILAQRDNYSPFVGTITNNLSYQNDNQGIYVQGGYGTQIINNTVYQLVGDAVRTDTGSTNIRIRNNILWDMSPQSNDLYVSPESEIGLDSDYNDLYATNGGNVAWWEGSQFATQPAWFFAVGQDRHSLSVDPQFVDPAGPDGILGYSTSPIAGTEQTVDDSSSSGFQLQGSWTLHTGAGYLGTYEESNSSTTPDKATWTFTNLTPGTYEVAVTWPASSNLGNGLYTMLDGTQRIGQVVEDQSQAPAGINYNGATWTVLGIYYVSGHSLSVQLTSQSGTIVADGAYLQQLSGDGGLDDNFHLQAGSPAIDEGDPATDFLNEPAPNGGRVNLGYDGNTPQTQTSSNPELQVLSPSGYEKYMVGQQVGITWRSDGLVGPANYYANDITGNDNPYAFYRLNESTGTTAADSSVNGLNGTYASSGVTYGVSGALPSDSDTSVQFDGQTGDVNLPSGFDNYFNGFSFDVWVYPTANNGEQFFSLGDGSSSDVVQLGNGSNNDLVFTVGDTSVTAPGAISLDQWQYFAVTLTPTFGMFGSSAQVTLYKNGAEIASGTTNLPSSVTRDSNFLGMGTLIQSFYGPPTQGGAFSGAMQEAAFYTSTLSAGRILDHYERQYYGTVNINLVTSSGSFVMNIATGVTNNDAFTWTIPLSGITLDQYYKIQIVSVQYPTVSGSSNNGFQITNNGHDFYINDNSTAGDVYTSAVGNDLNSGKSPDAPMMTLAALIATYEPGTGDVIYIDTGSYRLYRNIVLGTQNNGLAIIGPQGAGAINNRGNTNSSRVAFELDGAFDLILENLTITGGQQGIITDSGTNNSYLTVANCVVYDNPQGGVLLQYGTSNATVTGTTTYGKVAVGQMTGISVSGDNATVNNNTAYNQMFNISVSGNNATVNGNTVYTSSNSGLSVSGNNMTVNGNTASFCSTGISLSGSGTASGDVSHDNSGDGIDASANSMGSFTVTASTAYSDNIGIHLGGSAIASHNVSHNNNSDGILADSVATVLNNRAYANLGAGIHVYFDSTVSNNDVYDCAEGILGDSMNYSPFTGTITNNLTYANANQGILIHGGQGASIINNTVYQVAGDAIHIDQNSMNMNVYNNIMYILAGYCLYVEPASQVTSDYNLYFLGTTPDPRAHLAWYNSSVIDLNTGGGNPLANLVAAGLDALSVYGDPLFTDISGPDGILGYTTAHGGYDGGLDDNFYLSPGSPAIGAGDAMVAPATDILGYSRSGSADLGAYEFLGSNNDTTPPVVVSTTPAALNNNGTMGLGYFQITFSKRLNPIDATNVENYDLRAPGPDGLYNTGDDVVVPLVVTSYNPATFTVTLTIGVSATTLAGGAYRFTIFSNDHGRGIRDASDNWLGGGDYIRNITVAPDIHVNAFTADGGSNVTVTYEIEHGNISPFAIGFYLSSDATWNNGDTALSTVQVTAPADLTVGQHTVTFVLGSGAGQVALPGAGSPDVSGNYFLLAVADPSDAIATEGNDDPLGQDFVAAFTGAYQLPGGSVYIHGSAGSDLIRLLGGRSIVVLRMDGGSYDYDPSSVFAVRLHAGNDVMDASGVSNTMQVWVGSGVDNLTGSTGTNTFYVPADASTSSVLIGMSSGSNTLVGPDTDSQWNITTANGGNLNGVAFSNFQNLTGGAGNDVFAFADGQGVTGTVDGGGGSNTLDFSAYSTGLNINLQTGATNAGAASFANVENIIGGAGGDVFVGSAAGGFLVGGSGANTITAGAGRSILIGGGGPNTLTAGSSGDILIQGTTDYDHNIAALMSLMAEWQSSDSYATRIADLRSGGGLANGYALIWGTTVHDNGQSNTLNGNASASGDELDWFFASAMDTINNLLPGEQVD